MNSQDFNNSSDTRFGASFFDSVANLTNKESSTQTNQEHQPTNVADIEDNQYSETLPDENITEPDENTTDGSDMPSDARRALIYLSQQGVVLASQKPQLFNTILQHQKSIRRHLSELYCSLVIDQHGGVAFVARADFVAQNSEQLTGCETLEDTDDVENNELEGEDVSSLIQKRTLTVYDTLLLLNLRKYYQERQNLGETEIIIDIEKLENMMSPFLALTDHGSKDKKKLSAKLDDFARKHKLVIAKSAKGRNSSKSDSQERYQITPMIRYVVNANLLQAMLDEYQALLGEKSDEALNEEKQDISDDYLGDSLKECDNHKLTDNASTKITIDEQPSAPQQDSLF